ncbi:hypothetical protein Hanom_Chr12g01092271 [Helianthus anomalus]
MGGGNDQSSTTRTGGLWLRVQQIFVQLRGPDHNRTIDTLSSRFRVVRLECQRFDRYFKKVEREMPDLVEDNQKEVTLINYRHGVDCSKLKPLQALSDTCRSTVGWPLKQNLVPFQQAETTR